MKASPHYYESDLQEYYTYARSILHVLKQNKAGRLVFTQWQTHKPVTVHLRTCWSEKAHWTRTGNDFFHAELHSSPLSPSTPSSSYHSIPSFHTVFSYVTTVEVAPLSYRWHCSAYTAATWVRTLKLYVTTAIALELRTHRAYHTPSVIKCVIEFRLQNLSIKQLTCTCIIFAYEN